ncbi:MAG: transcription antitermination factor NusB [Helicobacteraceae bacterium]|nr:transcription antitermination factor NusB [Helicobacteraceae bacterium]
MSSARHQARILAIQLLYSSEMGSDQPCALIEESRLSKKYTDFAAELFNEVSGSVAKLDAKISASLNEEWTIERLGVVERAILRLGAYELLRASVDSAIAINEAVELSKEMADENAPPLINGVLENVRKSAAR